MPGHESVWLEESLYAHLLEQLYWEGWPQEMVLLGFAQIGALTGLVAEGQLQTKALIISTEQCSGELQFHISISK